MKSRTGTCLLVMVSLCLMSLAPARVVVRDVRVQQRWPWNGKVDITYMVDCDEPNADGTPQAVQVSFLGYDGDQDRVIAMRSLKGDGVLAPVTAGGPYHVVWDADDDYKTFNSSAFQVRVKARLVTAPGPVPEPDPVPPPAAGRYLVIDLSAGSTAAAFPHRYSETGPDLSSDACRTRELWLREVPAGTFLMGSPASELGRDAEEEVQRQVTLTKPFFVGVFEVSQDQWQRVMGKGRNPSRFLGADRPVENVTYDMIRGSGAGAWWPEGGHAVNGDAFLGVLRKKTGLTFDLPTEAQWEYACRAGTTSALNTGRNLTGENQCVNLAQAGRYRFNCADGRGGYGQYTRCGSYLPNAWGLYDMHGNVEEWCLDWEPIVMSPDPVTDPVGPRTGKERVMRGGSCDEEAEDCRSAACGDGKPTYPPGMTTYDPDDFYGFRLVVLP